MKTVAPVMSFEIPLEYSRTPPPDAIPLEYDALPTSLTQSRYCGRLELRPQLRLMEYEFRGFVDWIEVGIRIERITQPKYVRRDIDHILTESDSVLGPYGSKVYTGDEFRVRFQAPSPERLFRSCSEIEKTLKLMKLDNGERFFISAIEFGIDIYPYSRADSERQLMTEVVRRHLLAESLFFEKGPRHPRVMFEEGGKPRDMVARVTPKLRSRIPNDAHPAYTAEHLRDLNLRSYRQPYVDGTFYLGEKGEGILIRVQDKITDRRNPEEGTYETLEAHARRTRIEIELTKHVPEFTKLQVLSDLRKKPFGLFMQKAFRMMIPTVATKRGKPDKRELEIFKRAGVMGLDRYQQAKHVKAQFAVMGENKDGSHPAITGLGAKRYLMAWGGAEGEDFNKKAARAIYNLGKRWAKG